MPQRQTTKKQRGLTTRSALTHAAAGVVLLALSLVAVAGFQEAGLTQLLGGRAGILALQIFLIMVLSGIGVLIALDRRSLLARSRGEREHLDDQITLMSRALQSSSNEVYIIDALTLRIHFANQAAVENLGYSQQTLNQMRVPEIALEMQDSERLQWLSDQLEENGELKHRYVHRRSDGSEYQFEFNVTLLRQSERLWLIVLGNDVSERLSREQALHASEERLNLAVQGSNDGVFDYDINNAELYLSDLVRDWLGASDQAPTSDQVPGSIEKQIETMLARVHCDDLQSVRRAVIRCLHQGEDFDVEFRFRKSADGYRWLQLRGRGIQLDQQTPTRITGFVSDISRRKVAESLLKDTVARLGAVLDNIAEGIITLNEDGEVCAVNPACEQMLGCDRETLISQPFRERLQMGTEAWSTIADRQPREYLALRADDEYFPAELVVSELDMGTDERFIVVFRDISERKQVEGELHRALADTQAATRAKDEFLATMSHEIRTPMNGVLGMTQLLLDTPLTTEQQETAQIIYSSGEALLTIINDILDFSKIESGRLQLEVIPFDFRVALREVMELLAPNRERLDLYVDYPVDVPGHLLGDVGRIRQVLMNLVGNALKFTEQGHVLVRVEDMRVLGSGIVDPAEVGGLSPDPGTFAQLKISVIDTGVGISESAQANLFESFTQADTSTTRRFGGTGLGLAISKRLVELMDGEIGFVSDGAAASASASTSGSGSSFWFTLNLPTYSEDPQARIPEALRGLRVLVVDNNELGRNIFAHAFARAGIDAEIVADGPQALEAIAARKFELVLLDYQLPGIDGLELAGQLRGFDADLGVVMLTCTDLRGSETIAELDGYAVKPVMQETLYKLLASALDHPSAPLKRDNLQPLDPPEGGNHRHRVLLAEDNVVNQKVAVRMLEKLGATVDVAANGQEAVEMWERFPYAIVFMDCQMPELDGLEATRQIRQLEIVDDRHTPIVAMTANAQLKDEEDCLSAGMDDYLAKPVKTLQLHDMLQRWCPPPP